MQTVNYAALTPDDYSENTAVGMKTESTPTYQINRCVVTDPPQVVSQASEKVTAGK